MNPDGRNFEEAILRKYALHERAFAERAALPIASNFFGQEADWAFQNYPALKGREAIGAFFETAVDQAAVSIEPIAAKADGSLGWSLCAYRVVPRDGAEASFTYRTLFNWEQVDGDWLVRVAMGIVES